jgi:Tfp pilus assembly protein PilN
VIAINLIPERVVLAKRRRRRLRAWSCILLLSAAVCAVPVSVEAARNRRVRSLRADRTQLLKDIEKSRAELNRIRLDVQDLKAEAARADALRTKRPWATLLAMLSDTLPKEMWLVSVATDPATPPRGDVDRTAETPPTPPDEDAEAEVVMLEAPRKLTLDGYAVDYLSLLRFMSDLNTCKAFQTVSLTRAVDEPTFDATAVRFKILCEW